MATRLWQNSALRKPNAVARSSLWRNLAKWGAGNPQGLVAKPVAAISAFRNRLLDADGKPINDPLRKRRINRTRNERLKADLVRLGFGFYPVKGAGQEVRTFLGFSWIVPTEEESLIVQARADTREASFLEIVRQLLEQYQQDVAIVKVPSTPVAFLLSANGDRTPWGRGVRPRRRGDEFYTVKIKGPRASDSMLEAWELYGERMFFRRLTNWLRGRSDMNRPRMQRGGRRYTIPFGG
jgi:hypothetical protein